LNALAKLGGLLSDSSRRVLRWRADGRSHLIHQPEWLLPATDLDFLLETEPQPTRFAVANTPTRLFIQAPALTDAAPEMFQQLQLWESQLKPQDTAISLFEESLRDAVTGEAQSDRIDRNILGSIADFSSVLDMGFDSISLNGGPSPAVEITRAALEEVGKLVVKAPEPRKVVVSGTLDVLRFSKRSFVLEVRGGRKIRGFYSPSDLSVSRFFGQEVVVDAEAVFRPSGDVASITALQIRRAQQGDEIWQVAPKAEPRSLDELQPRLHVAGGGSAFARIFGSWPGDESDEEIEEMLADLR